MTAITRRAALRGAAAIAATGAVPVAAMANIIEFAPRASGLAEERRELERQIATRVRETFPLVDRVNEITELLGDGEERRKKFMMEHLGRED